MRVPYIIYADFEALNIPIESCAGNPRKIAVTHCNLVLRKSSCTHALFTVNESIKYFTKRGSKVYCTFLDATKAFDKVLHNGLYKKLLEASQSLLFV